MFNMNYVTIRNTTVLIPFLVVRTVRNIRMVICYLIFLNGVLNSLFR